MPGIAKPEEMQGAASGETFEIIVFDMLRSNPLASYYVFACPMRIVVECLTRNAQIWKTMPQKITRA